METMIPVRAPSKIHWLFLVIGCCAVVITALIGPKISSQAYVTENRVLAAMPEPPSSPVMLAKYFDQLDHYLRDQFPMRIQLITALNKARFQLGYSHSARILVGRDQWLFFDSGNHLEYYRGTRLLPGELADIIQGAQQRAAQVKAAGGRYYIIFPPYKPGVYPEKLPAWFPTPPQRFEVDQIFDGLADKGFTQFVDIRPALLEAKEIAPVFSPRDTHWRAFGAYIGYRALMTRIAQDLPDLAPVDLQMFERFEPIPPLVPRDLEAMFGIGRMQYPKDSESYRSPIMPGRQIRYLTERTDWTSAHVLTTGYGGGRTALVLRDSFSLALVPFLERHFERIVLVHYEHDPNDRKWFDPKLLEEYKPDVVIHEMQEMGARFAFIPLE
jgi:hypothetical protein